MMHHTEIDWGIAGIRLRKEPAEAAPVTPLRVPLAEMVAVHDYRDLVIEDLADENALLRERLDDADHREGELRAWGRSYRELAHRATAMLARVTYERDQREQQIRHLMGIERYYGDTEGSTDAAA